MRLNFRFVPTSDAHMQTLVCRGYNDELQAASAASPSSSAASTGQQQHVVEDHHRMEVFCEFGNLSSIN